MAKMIDGITVGIDCKISITKESAERAMRIVEMFMQDHPELTLKVLGLQSNNGDCKLRLFKKGEEDGPI